MYTIREDLSINSEASQEKLLESKRNFKIQRYSIESVVIDAKKSMWTGGRPNNGTMHFYIGDKKQKYLIHPIESPKKVADFFKMGSSLFQVGNAKSRLAASR